MFTLLRSPDDAGVLNDGRRETRFLDLLAPANGPVDRDPIRRGEVFGAWPGSPHNERHCCPKKQCEEDPSSKRPAGGSRLGEFDQSEERPSRYTYSHRARQPAAPPYAVPVHNPMMPVARSV
jgi:hypothetical protein